MRKLTPAQQTVSTNMSIPIFPSLHLSIHTNLILFPEVHFADTMLIIMRYDGVIAYCKMTQILSAIAKFSFLFVFFNNLHQRSVTSRNLLCMGVPFIVM